MHENEGRWTESEGCASLTQPLRITTSPCTLLYRDPLPCNVQTCSLLRRAVGILLECFPVSNCVLYLLLSNGTNHNCLDDIVYIEPFKQYNDDE